MSRRYGFAHRGGSAHGPDNTLETFRTALDRGATGLETDAWVTADHQVVLDHDGVLRAAMLRRRPIARLRRSELPPHIPTLAELYGECGTDFDLAVDVKSTAVAQAVLDAARDHGVTDRLWLVAPHSMSLRGIDAAHPVVTVKAVTMRGPRRRPVMRLLREAGIHAINARWPWWTARYVADAHELGLLAFGYDAQQPSSLRRSFGIGLDGVFSDHVDRMVAALRAATD